MFGLTLCFLHSVSLVLYVSFLVLLGLLQAAEQEKAGRCLTLTVEHCLRICVYWINRLRGGGGVFLERGMGNVFPKTMSFPRDLALTS